MFVQDSGCEAMLPYGVISNYDRQQNYSPRYGGWGDYANMQYLFSPLNQHCVDPASEFSCAITV